MVGDMSSSLEERGIQKGDLSLRDRVMAMKGEDHLENLVKASGDVGLVEKAVRQLERTVEAFNKEGVPAIQKLVQREVAQLEQFIQQAERGEVVDPEAVKSWAVGVSGAYEAIPDMPPEQRAEQPLGGMHS